MVANIMLPGQPLVSRHVVRVTRSPSPKRGAQPTRAVPTLPVPAGLLSGFTFPALQNFSLERILPWGTTPLFTPITSQERSNDLGTSEVNDSAAVDMWRPSNQLKGLPAETRGRWERKAFLTDVKVSICCVSVDWVGRRALTGSSDGNLRLWDLDTFQSRGPGSGHKRTWILQGHASSVWVVIADWAGKQALSGSQDRSLKLWDLVTGDLKRSFGGHTDTVYDVSAEWGRKLMLSASWDSTLKLWNLDTGECYRTLLGHTMGACAIAVDWVWRCALSGSGDSSLMLWDLEAGKPVEILTGHTGGVRALSVDWFKRRVLSGSGDSTIKLWDLQSGKCQQTFHGHRKSVCAVIADWVWRRAVSSSHDGSVKLWDIDAGTCLKSFDYVHDDWVWGLAADWAARQILSGCKDGALRLVDLESGKILWGETL